MLISVSGSEVSSDRKRVTIFSVSNVVGLDQSVVLGFVVACARLTSDGSRCNRDDTMVNLKRLCLVWRSGSCKKQSSL